MTIRKSLAALCLAACAALPAGAHAVEIRVLSAGALKTTLTAVVASFEQVSGHTVRIEYGPARPLTRRVREGEAADLLINSAEGVDELADSGKTAAATRRTVGIVGIGVAIREGYAVPDIRTEKAFRETLLKARSIAAINPERGTSGRHFASVLERLGIAEAVKPRLKLVDGGSTAELVARGEAEIAVQQASELIAAPGITLIGPLPGTLQKETAYVAIVLSSAPNPAAARDFIAYLASPEVAAVLRIYGFKPPN